MTTPFLSFLGDTEEDPIQKNSWAYAFSRIHPTQQILPFILSVLSFAGITKTSLLFFKRDIQNLTDANNLQNQFLSMDPPLDPHLDELQKDLIHTVRKLAIHKILTKIALISSFAILSIGEYWALSGTPVRNLRFCSLLSGTMLGATSLCQYAYQGVEGLLLERLIEMQED
jgi:hypothetical protein